MESSGKKRWQDLTTRQRGLIIGAGVVQLTLCVAALRDLRRRPTTQIRGPKAAWVAVSFINTLGPITYFLCGRKKPGA